MRENVLSWFGIKKKHRQNYEKRFKWMEWNTGLNMIDFDNVMLARWDLYKDIAKQKERNAQMSKLKYINIFNNIIVHG